MVSDDTVVRIPEEAIERAADFIQESLLREKGVEYSKPVIGYSIRRLFEVRLDRFVEDIDQVLTSPHLPEAKELYRILEEALSEPRDAADKIQAAVPASVFSGFKVYSTEKFGAMVEYFAAKGNDIYKTNLNKLMFYADMTYFAGRRQSISGATYVNLPFGPVPDGYEEALNELAAQGRIKATSVPILGKNAQRITSANIADPSSTALSSDETRLLEWVFETYGLMSATEISEMSHLEKAYANTRRGEPIAYEYAKFLNRLPPKSFWT